MKRTTLLCFFMVVLWTGVAAFAATPALYGQKEYKLVSPNGGLEVKISAGDQLRYEVMLNGVQILTPSPLSMTVEKDKQWGIKAQPRQVTRQQVDRLIETPLYRKRQIAEQYNQLTLRYAGGYAVEFRAYNDGMAYRFIYQGKSPLTVCNEQVAYQLPANAKVTLPYVLTGEDGDYESQFFNSFENTYTTDLVARLNPKRLAFLPLLVDVGQGVKCCISECDLEHYPGLYLLASTEENALKGVLPRYPKAETVGGHNNLQMIVTEREAYIAQVDGPCRFPWRMMVVSSCDKELAASDLTYLLAQPNRLDDLSWIKPGKVAWEWWNDWKLTGVPFQSGVNTETYKAYVDFAAEQGIEYVILDEGWAVEQKADLMQVVDEIQLKELVDYAAERQIGIILWAGYLAFQRDMEKVCQHYAEMGVKGFKVDFMDRDDQQMTHFLYEMAETCARYHLMLDLHGTHKPAGLNRTYPHVVNYEDVHGLEWMKFGEKEMDQVTYDVMLPFIRQVAGPMDYTPGAMRNVAMENFSICNSEPMSQGTRCRQLALYLVLDAPLAMLCDSPSAYQKESECTKLIAAMPTVWDETLILDGKVGEYIVMARRKGDTWYLAGLTNWQERDVELNLSALALQGQSGVLFHDGANAKRFGSDYAKQHITIPADGKLTIHLAPGGGFVFQLITK